MTTETVVRYKPRGSVADLWKDAATECLIEGPAGTGKTRGVLEYMHAVAIKYPKSKQLIARKTQTALAGAALATYRDKVAGEELRTGAIEHFGGSGAEPPGFRYSNGSTIQYRGLDDIDKTLSTEYDNVYVNEATECTEDDWELLTRCLRNGVTPRQRLIGDCNPSTDRHWLLRRCNTGQTRRLRSTVRDNPLYWDESLNDYTPEGKSYIEDIVGNMTGTRRQRLFEGQWVGMENAVYPQLDPSVQLKSLSAEMARQPFSWVKSVGGGDYGEVHLSALAGLSKDSLGRKWIRRCWTGKGGNRDELKAAWRNIASTIRIGDQQQFVWGLTDPNQGYMASDLGWESASKPRKPRIDRISTWLDENSIFWDADDPEVVESFYEALAYRWELSATATLEKLVPVRIDDNRIASIEYAGEAMESGSPGTIPPQARGTSYERPPTESAFRAVYRQQQPIKALGGQA